MSKDAGIDTLAIDVVKPPIILLGMHRSGTSLIARLLDDLGLFQGHELQEDHESTHFLEINETLLKRAGASWDNPTAIRSFLANAAATALALRCLREDFIGKQVAGFLGRKRFRTYRGVIKLDLPWGWKDPRTVFTLPLWLGLFPKSKLVYIVRNGVDVASSLRVRERRELDRRIEQFEAKKKSGSRLSGHSLLQRAGFKGSGRCLSLDNAFSLWEEYVAEAERQLATAPSERMVIIYERFLRDPHDAKTGLDSLAKFCGLNVSANAMAQASKTINAGRAKAFLSDPELADFYQQVKGSQWMTRYGYAALDKAD